VELNGLSVIPRAGLVPESISGVERLDDEGDK